jgi:hypothetical protein
MQAPADFAHFGAAGMPEPTFTMTADDDLPRTIRRERDAREREAREARERQAREREREPALAPPQPQSEREAAFALPAPAATVTAIDVPFLRLMMFFIKAVFAGVPALILLTALLWMLGQGLQSYFPQLLKMKIDVQIYAPQSAADFRDNKARR